MQDIHEVPFTTPVYREILGLHAIPLAHEIGRSVVLTPLILACMEKHTWT